MSFGVRLALLVMVAAACSNAPEPRTAAGRSLQLSEDAAPSSYVKLRELSVTSGHGCGFFGERGSREGAERLLRDAAGQLGASYVQVTTFEPPRPNHQCMEHEYKMTGVAYRDPAAPPVAPPPDPFAAPAAPTPLGATTSSSAASTAPAPASSSATAAGVCVPGATQACLGPGACQGAQACRDDASGFLPCDCGTRVEGR